MKVSSWKLTQVIVRLGFWNWVWTNRHSIKNYWTDGDLLRFIKKYDWYMARPICIEVKYNPYEPLYSFDCNVLGFGAYVSIGSVN